MAPFQTLYGRPPTITHYQVGTTPVNEVDQNLTSRDDLLCQLKQNIYSVNNQMK